MSKHIDAKIGLAYVERRLDAAQRAKLERHLADCPACQAQLHEHQAMHNLLQATGQDFAPEPSQVPNWADVRPPQQKQASWRNVFSNSTQLMVAGVAVLLLFVFVWQLQSAVPIFEPAAPGFATATPTSDPLETAVPSSSVQAAPAATIFPEIFPTGSVPTITGPTAGLQQTISGTVVSAVSANAQGRVAFVVDGTLFVETSGTLAAIANHALPDILAWSPDGEKLLFFSQLDEAERPFLSQWDVQTGQTTPLSELVSRSLPETGFSHVHWSENGRELLLISHGQLAPDSEWDAGVWLANLDTGKLNLIVEALSLADATWLSADTFMLALDCGNNCTILMAYDREQNMLWKAYADQPEWAAASDLFVHQPANQRILHLNTHHRPQTVDVLDIETGEIASIWTVPDGLRFADTQPYLAENGRLLIFQVLDENEQITTQVLDIETDTSASSVQAVFPHMSTAIQSGNWNPAGDIFSYAILNPSDNASYVYLWHVADDTKELIHTSNTMSIQNFIWTGDGERLFFNVGNQELWQYDIASGELQLLVGP